MLWAIIEGSRGKRMRLSGFNQNARNHRAEQKSRFSRAGFAGVYHAVSLPYLVFVPQVECITQTPR